MHAAAANFDFGYPWWLSYGHVVVLIPTLAALLAGKARKWTKWPMLLLAAVALWSAGALIALQAFGINSLPSLPTPNFFRSGVGRVLDIGAGTGRSSIMVLEARPQATLVALDQFGQSFESHFGHPGATPQQRLLANLKAAGVDHRATIETADMRKLPFESSTFDAVVSAYAIDHLPREGVKQSLAEAARVMKPGGEFLMMLVSNDRWVKFAFGPVLSHGGTRGPAWWSERVREAGFETLETGTTPATLYFLLRRP